jgi:hypothetical protein
MISIWQLVPATQMASEEQIETQDLLKYPSTSPSFRTHFNTRQGISPELSLNKRSPLIPRGADVSK